MPQKGQFSEADITSAAGQFSEADLAAPAGSTTLARQPNKIEQLSLMRNASPTQFELEQRNKANTPGQSIRETASKALPYVGAALGGAVGGASGFMAGAGLGAIPGAVAGSALGYAAGESLQHGLNEEPMSPTKIPESMATGAMLEMGGQATGALLGRAGEAGSALLRSRFNVTAELQAAAEARQAAEETKIVTGNQAAAKYKDIMIRRQLENEAITQGNQQASLQSRQEVNNALSAWKEQTAVVHKANDANAMIAQRSFDLSANRAKIERDLFDEVNQFHTSVRSGLDTRWQSLRQSMQGTVGDANAVAKAVQQSRKLVSETNRPELEGVIKNAFGDAHTLDWRNMQAAYTNLSEIRAAGNMSGDTARATKDLQTSIGSEMSVMAKTKGLDQDLSALKNDWSHYMTDFREGAGVKASPVASAIRYPDSQPFMRRLSGTGTERAKDVFNRWGNPGITDKLNHYQAMGDELNTLPRFKAAASPTMPSGFITPFTAQKGPALYPASNITTLPEVPAMPEKSALQQKALDVWKTKMAAKTKKGAAIIGGGLLAGWAGATAARHIPWGE